MQHLARNFFHLRKPFKTTNFRCNGDFPSCISKVGPSNSLSSWPNASRLFATAKNNNDKKNLEQIILEEYSKQLISRGLEEDVKEKLKHITVLGTFRQFRTMARQYNPKQVKAEIAWREREIRKLELRLQQKISPHLMMYDYKGIIPLIQQDEALNKLNMTEFFQKAVEEEAELLEEIKQESKLDYETRIEYALEQDFGVKIRPEKPTIPSSNASSDASTTTSSTIASSSVTEPSPNTATSQKEAPEKKETSPQEEKEPSPAEASAKDQQPEETTEAKASDNGEQQETENADKPPDVAVDQSIDDDSGDYEAENPHFIYKTIPLPVNDYYDAAVPEKMREYFTTLTEMAKKDEMNHAKKLKQLAPEPNFERVPVDFLNKDQQVQELRNRIASLKCDIDELIINEGNMNLPEHTIAQKIDIFKYMLGEELLKRVDAREARAAAGDYSKRIFELPDEMEEDNFAEKLSIRISELEDEYVRTHGLNREDYANLSDLDKMMISRRGGRRYTPLKSLPRIKDRSWDEVKTFTQLSSTYMGIWVSVLVAVPFLILYRIANPSSGGPDTPIFETYNIEYNDILELAFEGLMAKIGQSKELAAEMGGAFSLDEDMMAESMSDDGRTFNIRMPVIGQKGAHGMMNFDLYYWGQMVWRVENFEIELANGKHITFPADDLIFSFGGNKLAPR